MKKAIIILALVFPFPGLLLAAEISWPPKGENFATSIEANIRFAVPSENSEKKSLDITAEKRVKVLSQGSNFRIDLDHSAPPDAKDNAYTFSYNGSEFRFFDAGAGQLNATHKGVPTIPVLHGIELLIPLFSPFANFGSLSNISTVTPEKYSRYFSEINKLIKSVDIPPRVKIVKNFVITPEGALTVLDKDIDEKAERWRLEIVPDEANKFNMTLQRLTPGGIVISEIAVKDGWWNTAPLMPRKVHAKMFQDGKLLQNIEASISEPSFIPMASVDASQFVASDRNARVVINEDLGMGTVKATGRHVDLKHLERKTEK